MPFLSLAYGDTRVVLLIGLIAIKFPRPRIEPLWWIKRFLFYFRRGEVVKQMTTRYHENLLLAVAKYIGMPVFTNWDEWRISCRYLEYLPIAPTYFSFLGLINVQPRGKPIQGKFELPVEFALLVASNPQLAKTLRKDNFCQFGERILLVDYGERELRRAIKRTFKLSPAFA